MSFSTHAEYDLTKNPQAVPQFLLDAWVLTVSVEFLELNSKGVAVTEKNNQKNHVLLKFSLLHQAKDLITVYLDMRIDDSRRITELNDGKLRHQLGKLIIYTADRKREYTRSACTYTIYLTKCLKFEEIILDITESGIQHFNFANIGDRYFGCRDFMFVSNLSPRNCCSVLSNKLIVSKSYICSKKKTT